MQITLSFMELVSLFAMLLGGAFVLLKLAAFQFLKNINTKFADLDKDIVEQSRLSQEATNDKIRLHRAEVELANERRHSAYLEKFHTKEEASALSIKHDKVFGDIFKMLHSINDKFENTVSTKECSDKRGQHGQ